MSRLEVERDTKLLIYFTGDRRGLETKIGSDVLPLFTRHLDAIGPVPRISLFLYTQGGDTLAAWSLANLVRQFCDTMEVVVPAKAHSAGTLISLGADTILMTKQATLGPIDPSVSTPLNPSVPGAPPHIKIPVSVEDVGGFMDFARSVSDKPETLTQALSLLAGSVHPLVLGSAFRARTQIRMLAKKLIGGRFQDDDHVERILRFLCSESGSHDYTINRREARDELGLPVAKPTSELYSVIKALYDDLEEELLLTAPFDQQNTLGASPEAQYRFSRAVIQSLAGGTHTFVSEGVLRRVQVQTPQGLQPGVSDERSFEGWRYSNA